VQQAEACGLDAEQALRRLLQKLGEGAPSTDDDE
jgi:hypothetical protein